MRCDDSTYIRCYLQGHYHSGIDMTYRRFKRLISNTPLHSYTKKRNTEYISVAIHVVHKLGLRCEDYPENNFQCISVFIEYPEGKHSGSYSENTA
jgi:hypothetical protein